MLARKCEQEVTGMGDAKPAEILGLNGAHPRDIGDRRA